MLGRGIDQVLPHSNNPVLYEGYVKSALGYVALAERANGPIKKPVTFAYPWGDASAEMSRRSPHVRIINLETSLTTSDQAWPGKGIHYRMHPKNVVCLTAAKIDCCVLANNHVLDWGQAGLMETLRTLRVMGLKTAGAGEDLAGALAPAVFDLAGDGRVLVFAFGVGSSGILPDWAATKARPGVHLLPDLSEKTAAHLAAQIQQVKRPGTLVVASLHWGGNWGYEIPETHRRFAHRLIEEAGVDVVHGHSSHHPRAIEVHRERLILYGCGDLINDYEGIRGHEEFRSGLCLLYFPMLEQATGRLLRLEMAPFCIRRFRLQRASDEEARSLRDTLDRECTRFGGRVETQADGSLRLRWEG
jgi:poly-gamma-glutamate synthesis protein (capsule biosynthesis protein)